ncbi:MAG: nucleoid-associated protein YgaU [Candidatus Paceibacteria bacterium]|jgi:nucleoid-associated protein YgaU
MQRIERYGVIALVLLIVTIAAVSFWDDGMGLGEPKKLGQEAVERLAQKESVRTPVSNRAGGNRKLPTTAARSGDGTKKPRRSNAAVKSPVAEQTSNVPKQGQGAVQKGFSTLPATIVPRSEDRTAQSRGGQTFVDDGQVEFPASLKGDGLKNAGSKNAGQSTLANRAGVTQPQEKRTTNYQSIQDREADMKAKGLESRAEKSALRNQQPVESSAGLIANSQAKSGIYTVESGDTLSEIAYKTLGSSKRWREIQDLNGNLDPAALHVGAELRIPGGSSTGGGKSLPTLMARERSTSSDDTGTYLVEKGDVLSQIAQDELGGASRWREIAALNPSIDPNVLMAGTRLRMPAGRSVASRYSAPARSSAKKKNHVR